MCVQCIHLSTVGDISNADHRIVNLARIVRSRAAFVVGNRWDIDTLRETILENSCSFLRQLPRNNLRREQDLRFYDLARVVSCRAALVIRNGNNIQTYFSTGNNVLIRTFSNLWDLGITFSSVKRTSVISDEIKLPSLVPILLQVNFGTEGHASFLKY